MSQMQWSNPPEMTIDSTKSYSATLQTENGDIILQLFATESPFTVNNFVFLARQGYYDGVTFHRVIAGFMAQGGDPTGTGGGGPGYLSLLHICRCRRLERCRSRWSPFL